MTSSKIDSNFFSESEIALIMGTLLGDGHLNKRCESYRIKIDHSFDQKEYILWKHNKLKRLCQTTQEPKEILDKKGNKGIEFYTSSSKEYKSIHSLFYQLQKVKEKSGTEKEKYVKVITRQLIDNLPTNPLVLATFYMDDGSVRNDCYAGKLATQGFSQEESKKSFVNTFQNVELKELKWFFIRRKKINIIFLFLQVVILLGNL